MVSVEQLLKIVSPLLMRDLMFDERFNVFSRAFCFDLVIRGDKTAREACIEIS